MTEPQCQHQLGINVRWKAKDGLEAMTCFCFKCGKSFECREFKVEENVETR